jgi:hypothetical protein
MEQIPKPNRTTKNPGLNETPPGETRAIRSAFTGNSERRGSLQLLSH